MLDYKHVAVIDHDWSLYRISGKLGKLHFPDNYAIIHDDDAISAEFWEDEDRVFASVINGNLGKRLEDYYD